MISDRQTEFKDVTVRCLHTAMVFPRLIENYWPLFLAVYLTSSKQIRLERELDMRIDHRYD